MTRIEAMLDYYELRYQQIILDIQALAQGPEREIESRGRRAMCAARKADQLRRARAAGLLDDALGVAVLAGEEE